MTLHGNRVLGAVTPGSIWYIARSLRTFHLTKNLLWFSPYVFPILLLGRGALHSQGDVLPAPAGFLLFLPQVSGGGTCWLQTSGEGVLSASLPRSFGILQVKALSVSTAAEDFPAQQGGFPVRWCLSIWEESG